MSAKKPRATATKLEPIYRIKLWIEIGAYGAYGSEANRAKWVRKSKSQFFPQYDFFTYQDIDGREPQIGIVILRRDTKPDRIA